MDDTDLQSAPTSHLSADHRRILHSHFQHLEDQLLDLDAILCKEQDNRMSSEVDRSRLDAARTRLAELREAMSNFARRWAIDMSRFEASNFQLATVHLAFLLSDLDDLNSDRLRGYGAVGQMFTEEYETLLQSLYAGLERIKHDVIPARSTSHGDLS